MPKPSDIDRAYPGFQQTYADAHVSAQANGGARIGRRCLNVLPDNVREVRWDTIETFEPDATGRILRRVAIEFVPGSEEQAPYTKCLAQSSHSIELVMPEGTLVRDTIEVRNAGIVYINDYTKEYLAQEVEVLRQRVADPTLTDARRAVLQDHLELWECYMELGMARRRDCLNR